MLDDQLNQVLTPELHGHLNSESLSSIFRGLDSTVNAIHTCGENLDETQKLILKTQKAIMDAKRNLEVAEATAMAFPKPGPDGKMPDLSNDAKRKAYLKIATQKEQQLISDLEDEKIKLESESLDDTRMYNKLQDSFRAIRYKADLVSSLLKYLTR